MAKKGHDIEELYREGFQNWEASYDKAELDQTWNQVQQQVSGSSGAGASSGSKGANGALQGFFSSFKGLILGSVSALVIGSAAIYWFSQSEQANPSPQEANSKEEVTESGSGNTNGGASADSKANNKSNRDKNTNRPQAGHQDENEDGQLTEKDQEQANFNESANSQSNSRSSGGGTNVSDNEQSPQNNKRHTSPATSEEKGEQTQEEAGKSDNYEKELPKVIFAENSSHKNDRPAIVLSDRALCHGQSLRLIPRELQSFHDAKWRKASQKDWQQLKMKDQLSWRSEGTKTLYFKVTNKKTGQMKASSKTIRVGAPPKADFSYSVEGYKVTFKNLSNNGKRYLWYFGDNNIDKSRQPTHYYQRKGQNMVKLIAISSKGCKDTMAKEVFVEGRPEVEIPNIFTPNGDGKNDQFVIENLEGVQHYHLVVHNDNGQAVYETKDPDEFWNGRLNNEGDACDEGRYQYILEYQFQDNKKMQTKKGTIILKRSAK